MSKRGHLEPKQEVFISLLILETLFKRALRLGYDIITVKQTLYVIAQSRD